jgi:hypothetical protein
MAMLSKRRTMVEVEWLVSLARFQDYVLYWIEWLVTKFIRTIISDWVRNLRVSKWRIQDGKVESGLMSDLVLLSGSPRPCRLRTTSVRSQ